MSSMFNGFYIDPSEDLFPKQVLLPFVFISSSFTHHTRERASYLSLNLYQLESSDEHIHYFCFH